MNEFVEECRREWRRLGVPDPIANEMAADLTADLEEAEEDGGSPEDVLGNSAFDPRRFAAAWATARGVTGSPAPHRPFVPRRLIVISLAIIFGVLILGASLALLVGRSSSSIAIVTHRIVAGPGSIRIFPNGAGRIVGPGPLGPLIGTQGPGVNVHPLAFLLLAVGVVGLGLLVYLYWSPWSGPRRQHRNGGRQTPSWH